MQIKQKAFNVQEATTIFFDIKILFIKPLDYNNGKPTNDESKHFKERSTICTNLFNKAK